MNIKEYISSGILESYVLGSCTPAEQSDVEANAFQYPEVKEELENIREALNSYVMTNEQTPPAFLKERIAATIKHGSTSLTITQEAKVIPLTKESGNNANRYKYLAAASIAFLIGSVYMNYHFYVKIESAKKDIAIMTKDNETIAQIFKEQDSLYALEKKKMEIKLAQLDMVKKPSMVAMPMKGKDIAPDAKVCVYGDSKTNEIFLEVNKLPKAPTGMQYQLWAIVKGKPINAGMIEMCEQPDTCGIHKMNTIADAHAFAISLEKVGGNETPKGDIFATFGI